MTPETYARAKDLLAEALERTADERARFVEASCQGDLELRREVESLLLAHSAAEQDGFLDEAPTLGAPLAEPESTVSPGRRIGPYEIVGELGRGGMGLVLRAVRADDAYRQTVALKLVPAAGASDSARRRFLEERQILATLEHPHIARLLDGGTTGDGLPYLVMELVEGEPIDEYCDRHGLSVEARVGLFLKVVEAVQHAHRNLVVHRDIKPANVLVSAAGAPKLLDFGIARLVEPGIGGAATDATVTALRMLTPHYASPEQVRGSALTTATDVYSLGVLLYVLLAGGSPYRAGSGQPHEVLAAVTTQEPEPPSVAVAHTPLHARRRRLAGDLDTIVLKAMRKEPAERYSSAEAFAEDLRRFLSAQPVLARRPTLSYRARKFVRRNPAAVAFGALAVTALLGGVAATTWQSRRAEAQRQRAERRFADVRKLANTFLFEVHDGVAPLAGSMPVRELLVKRGLEYLDSLAKEASGDRSLQVELGRAYRRVGDLQGGTFMANLGDISGAVASYRKAVGLLEAAGASGGDDLPDALRALSSAQVFRGELAAARASADRALALSRAATRADADPAQRTQLARSLFAVGFSAYHQGDLDASEAALVEQTQILEPLHTRAPADPMLAQLLAGAHWSLAGTLWGKRELPQAVQHYERARALQEAVLQAFPENAQARRQLAYTHESLGTLHSQLREHVRALPALERALALRLELARADPRNADARKNLAQAHKNLAMALALAGRPREAASQVESAQRLAEEALAADPRHVGLRVLVAECHGVQSMVLGARAEGAPALRLPLLRERRRWLARARGIYLELQQEGALSAAAARTLAEIEEADALYARELAGLPRR